MNFQVTTIPHMTNSNVQVYFYVQNVATYKALQISVNNYEIHKHQRNDILILQFAMSIFPKTKK
jgi:hypothetical protein